MEKEKSPLKQSQFHMFGIAPDETVVENESQNSNPRMLGDQSVQVLNYPSNRMIDTRSPLRN